MSSIREFSKDSLNPDDFVTTSCQRLVFDEPSSALHYADLVTNSVQSGSELANCIGPAFAVDETLLGGVAKQGRYELATRRGLCPPSPAVRVDCADDCRSPCGRQPARPRQSPQPPYRHPLAPTDAAPRLGRDSTSPRLPPAQLAASPHSGTALRPLATELPSTPRAYNCQQRQHNHCHDTAVAERCLPASPNDRRFKANVFTNSTSTHSVPIVTARLQAGQLLTNTRSQAIAKQPAAKTSCNDQRVECRLAVGAVQSVALCGDAPSGRLLSGGSGLSADSTGAERTLFAFPPVGEPAASPRVAPRTVDRSTSPFTDRHLAANQSARAKPPSAPPLPARPKPDVRRTHSDRLAQRPADRPTNHLAPSAVHLPPHTDVNQSNNAHCATALSPALIGSQSTNRNAAAPASAGRKKSRLRDRLFGSIMSHSVLECFTPPVARRKLVNENGDSRMFRPRESRKDIHHNERTTKSPHPADTGSNQRAQTPSRTRQFLRNLFTSAKRSSSAHPDGRRQGGGVDDDTFLFWDCSSSAAATPRAAADADRPDAGQLAQLPAHLNGLLSPKVPVRPATTLRVTPVAEAQPNARRPPPGEKLRGLQIKRHRSELTRRPGQADASGPVWVRPRGDDPPGGSSSGSDWPVWRPARCAPPPAVDVTPAMADSGMGSSYCTSSGTASSLEKADASPPPPTPTPSPRQRCLSPTGTLLDQMHRKYYSHQYAGRDASKTRCRSTERRTFGQQRPIELFNRRPPSALYRTGMQNLTKSTPELSITELLNELAVKFDEEVAALEKNHHHMKSAASMSNCPRTDNLARRCRFRFDVVPKLAVDTDGDETDTGRLSSRTDGSHGSSVVQLPLTALRNTPTVDPAYCSSTEVGPAPFEAAAELTASFMDDQNLVLQFNDLSTGNETELAEVEATEACIWLVKAGFPQYAQLFEDGQFPIDIGCVEKDHDFLDRDSIQSLFRRLNTLNRCASMRINATTKKCRDDSDDEEQCALSSNWRFQRSSRRWSRLDLPSGVTRKGVTTAPTDGLSDGLTSPDIVRYSSASSSSLDAVMPDSRPPVPSLPAVYVQHSAPSDSSEKLEQSLERSSTDGGEQRCAGRPERAEPIVERRSSASDAAGALSNAAATDSVHQPFVASPSAAAASHARPTPGAPNRSPLPPETSVTADVHFNANTRPPLPMPPPLPAPPSATSANQLPPPIPPRPANRPLVAPTGAVQLALSGAERTTNQNAASGPSPVVLRERKASKPLPGRNSIAELEEMFKTLDIEADLSSLLQPVLEAEAAEQARLASPPLVDFTAPYESELCTLTNDLDQILVGLSRDLGEMTLLQMVDQTLASPPAEPLSPANTVFTDDARVENSVAKQLITDAVTMETPSSVRSEKRSSNDSQISSDECALGNGEPSPADADWPVAEPAGTAGVVPRLGPPGPPRQRPATVGETATKKRERRDSGVGCSLTRAPSWSTGERKRVRIRWHSFQKSRRPSSCVLGLHLANLTSGQFMVLRRYAFLRLSALMDKHAPSPGRSNWNWMWPRNIMKRWSERNALETYKGRNVFGVPLAVMLERTGHPLPTCMGRAMECLLTEADDAVGIFRKAGVKSRVQTLKQQLEQDVTGSTAISEIPHHDLADLLKQFLRDLPECLLTNKLSDTLIKIQLNLPAEERLEALQLAIMLIPDENREVLELLLNFLHELAKHSDKNHMTAHNLALCVAPSLFRLSISRTSQITPRRNHKKSKQRSMTSLGVPDQKDLLEQRAACDMLTTMIENSGRLFVIPERAIGKYSFSYLQEGEPVAVEDLGRLPLPAGSAGASARKRSNDSVSPLVAKRRTSNATVASSTASSVATPLPLTPNADKLYQHHPSLPLPNTNEPPRPAWMVYMDSCVQGLLKEARDRFRSWTSVPTTHSGAELAYKTVDDGHPLRLWKCTCDVQGVPYEVLNWVLRQRGSWDDTLIKWSVVQRLADCADIVHYEQTATTCRQPSPASWSDGAPRAARLATRDFCEIRYWRADLPGRDGACALVTTSVRHPDDSKLARVSGVTLASRYLLEPVGSYSRLTHVCRVDLRGRAPDWYNKHFGHLVAATLLRLRDSFESHVSQIRSTNVPETKV